MFSILITSFLFYRIESYTLSARVTQCFKHLKIIMQPGILNHFPPAADEILSSNEKFPESWVSHKLERIDCLRKQISVLKCEFSKRNLRLTFYGSIQSKHAVIASYLAALLGFPRLKFYSYDNLFSLSFRQFFVAAEKVELPYLKIFISWTRPSCLCTRKPIFSR